MKTGKIAPWIALLVFAACAAPALAHHASIAEFDMDKKIALTGVISEVEWMNPHVYLHLDVKDNQGKVTTWAIECLPTRFFHNMGLSKAMMEAGQTVTIAARPAKIEGKPLAWLLKITYPDGHAYDFGDK